MANKSSPAMKAKSKLTKAVKVTASLINKGNALKEKIKKMKNTNKLDRGGRFDDNVTSSGTRPALYDCTNRIMTRSATTN